MSRTLMESDKINTPEGDLKITLKHNETGLTRTATILRKDRKVLTKDMEAMVDQHVSTMINSIFQELAAMPEPEYQKRVEAHKENKQ